jgi:ribosomal protein S27AE
MTEYKTVFKGRHCPRCGKFTIPLSSGTINEMHGHKLICSKCGKFVGWGGKKNPVGWKRDYGKQSA